MDNAKANVATANETCAELELGAVQCMQIRRTVNSYYNLLARLDTYLLPLVFSMENILATEGNDYRQYTQESKKVIASAASSAVTISNVMNVSILTAEGELTDDAKGKIATFAVA